MGSTSNSLVVGVAAGYRVEMILPFLKSLRATSYKGKVCLFVSGMCGEERRLLDEWADNVVRLDASNVSSDKPFGADLAIRMLRTIRNTRGLRRAYPLLFRSYVWIAPRTSRAKAWSFMERSLEGYQSLRYKVYLEYLQVHGTDADKVMITDVRDVLFQEDPFGEEFQDELEVFLEASHVRVGADPFNSRWIRNLFGAEFLQQIADKTVSCSGTTLGTRSGIVRYLEAMTAEVSRHQRPLCSHDQGIHNYLLWSGQLEPVHINANGHGSVLTLGEEKEIRQDSSGRLLNKDKSPANVIHQYDRHVDIALPLMARFQ